MKKLLVISLLICSCSTLPTKKTLRDAAKMACAIAQLAPDKTYQGQSVDYWCNLADELIDVYGEVKKLKDKEE